MPWKPCPRTHSFISWAAATANRPLSDIAWSLFENTQPGWPRVQAICDFVHRHIAFGYQHARATMTAWEVYNEGKGVCRDYAHLAITFCRCMNIPARYCTGYLSDIGTPQPWAAGDFAGWFEAYIGGRWQMFDPRNNVPRIGRILIAQGRDASDVPITQTFGPNTLVSFKVWTDEGRMTNDRPVDLSPEEFDSLREVGNGDAQREIPQLHWSVLSVRAMRCDGSENLA